MNTQEIRKRSSLPHALEGDPWLIKTIRKIVSGADLPETTRNAFITEDPSLRLLRRDPSTSHNTLVLFRDAKNHLAITFPTANKRELALYGRHQGAWVATPDAPKTFQTTFDEDMTTLCADPEPRPHSVFVFDAKRPFDAFWQATRFFQEKSWLAKAGPLRLHVDRVNAIVDPFFLFDRAGDLSVEIEEVQDVRAWNIVRPRAWVPGPDFRRLCDQDLNLQPPQGPDLFLTLEVEKRVWQEQVETLGLFLERVVESDRPVREILINGMTATADGSLADPEVMHSVAVREREICNSLQERVSKALRFRSLHGQTFTQKFEALSSCGFFLSPMGSGALIPLIRRIPGLVYQNSVMIEIVPGIDFAGFERVPGSLIHDRPELRGSVRTGRGDQNISYSIEPEAFADLALACFAEHARIETHGG